MRFKRGLIISLCRSGDHPACAERSSKLEGGGGAAKKRFLMKSACTQCRVPASYATSYSPPKTLLPFGSSTRPREWPTADRLRERKKTTRGIDKRRKSKGVTSTERRKERARTKQSTDAPALNRWRPLIRKKYKVTV